MKINRLKLIMLGLTFGIILTGCKDKKEPVSLVNNETESSEVVTSTEETERVEKNTISVVGPINLREETVSESTEENSIEEGKEDIDNTISNESEAIKENNETNEGIEVNLREDETEEREKESEVENILGEQYQNFSADMSELSDYKYVGYDGDSTVFLNIDDNKETTSMMVVIYRDNSYIQDKFGNIEDLEDEQKKYIGADLVKELTGISIDVNQTDFRDRESKLDGKYLGLPFGDSNSNSSGYLVFRIKKDKLECVMTNIDSIEPEDRKQMKDDTLKILESINFNGEECNSKYDIAFDNINIGIQKMKNGE